MIATIIRGRGNKREVIVRERNYAMSVACGKVICRVLGIADPKPSRPNFKGKRRPRCEQAVGG